MSHRGMVRTRGYFLAVTVMCLAFVMRFAEGAGPAVGALAPDFTLSSQDGQIVSLHDFLGKWVVLYFYPKDFSPGCTIEAREFQKDLKLYEALGATVLGVSMQSRESHKDFSDKEGLGFRLLSDPSGEVSASYGSAMDLAVVKLSLRKTFLIDPDGKIVQAFWNVSPYGHSKEVLAALSRLQRKPSSQRDRGKRGVLAQDGRGIRAAELGLMSSWQRLAG